ncbi:NAD-dependent epimerase/dehydratase family protein [Mitsuaria sp. 7]|uniref:NAD-dependent epimerase/dehydratase family protein n=1 Tax=Mitsuaria sp. 7 TaxID=1658665 RepID=UPI001E4FE987|nr:NAD-dependent epimerase/dehydratase family protein [Mitsuaria sp. 7]
MTGGSGYVAGWVIARLLDDGHDVRATLRDPTKAQAVRANIAGVATDTDRLEFVAADLLDDAGWDEAMHGVRHVAHVASPVMALPGVDTIAVAVEGTKRVLEAAARAGVERVVVTSSAAAASAGDGSSRAADEQDWTDPRGEGVGTYAASKTLAELAAWDFVREHPTGPKVATILPGFVLGPMLGTNASATLSLVSQMLTGKMPAVARLGFSMIDVRDLAALHALVLTDAQGMGERWIAGADFLWLSDVAALLKSELGGVASKVPTRTMPDWLVHLFALINTPMKPLLPDLGKRRAVSSAKAARLLGWHPRAAREAILATAESVIQHGRL